MKCPVCDRRLQPGEVCYCDERSTWMSGPPGVTDPCPGCGSTEWRGAGCVRCFKAARKALVEARTRKVVTVSDRPFNRFLATPWDDYEQWEKDQGSR